MFGMFRKKPLYEEICKEAGIALAESLIKRELTHNKLEAMGTGSVFSKTLRASIKSGDSVSVAINKATYDASSHMELRNGKREETASVIRQFCEFTNFSQMISEAIAIDKK